MPLSLLPLVMNQKTSPEVADSIFPSTKPGMLPLPSPALPWHERQFLA